VIEHLLRLGVAVEVNVVKRVAVPNQKFPYAQGARAVSRSKHNDIADVVRAAGWLSGLIVSNTTVERPASLTSPLKAQTGGLSGAPLMRKSTEVLKSFAGELKGEFDLIGAGGVASGADILAKLRAGAQAVQLYSAMVFEGPGIVSRLKAELVEIMAAEGVTSVAELAG